MRNITRIVLFLVALCLLGAFGFMILEGWDFLDSLYMAVITLTTVGLEPVHPLDSGGKVFVIVYLTVGIGMFMYGVVQIGEMLLRAQLRDWLGRRRMDMALKSLKDHFIVCGFGRMGRTLCLQLAAKHVPFVVVDKDEAVREECQQVNWSWLIGDATDDRVLQEGGVERARGLAAVLPGDADNLYVVLSARLLSRDIQIIARASDEKAAHKMKKAGANRVVNLYSAGASKVAQLLINPNVEEFLEVVTREGRELDLAEVHVASGASYVGKTLAETDFRRRGIIIVGIRRPGGELLLPPESTDAVQEGDYLIALGKGDSISELIQKA